LEEIPLHAAQKRKGGRSRSGKNMQDGKFADAVDSYEQARV
jgi:hypothetical protein